MTDTRLLAWNPTAWVWENLKKDVEKLQLGRRLPNSNWSVGRIVHIQPNSRFYLIRLGLAPKGLIGRGSILSSPEHGPHFSRRGKKSNYVEIEFESLRETPVIHWDDLLQLMPGKFWSTQQSGIHIPDEAAIALDKIWDERIRRHGAARPASALAEEFERKMQTPLEATEVDRIVSQRIGQPLFRKALIDYWGGQCAVTGIGTPELLRASHIKPWKECDSNQERLNPFNGLLLAVHLDALFDKGLISFKDSGKILISQQIWPADSEILGVSKKMKLSGLDERHRKNLAWHRKNVFKESE